jgi:hypothetical protein
MRLRAEYFPNHISDVDQVARPKLQVDALMRAAIK